MRLLSDSKAFKKPVSAQPPREVFLARSEEERGSKCDASNAFRLAELEKALRELIGEAGDALSFYDHVSLTSEKLRRRVTSRLSH